MSLDVQFALEHRRHRDLTGRDRNNSLAVHEFQNAVDRIFQRRVRLAPHRGIPCHLIGRVVIPFELHGRDVVDRAHQKIEQRKEKIFLPAPPDQLGNKIGDGNKFTLGGVVLSTSMQRVDEIPTEVDATLLEDRKPLIVKGMQITPAASYQFKKTDPSCCTRNCMSRC